MSGRVPKPKAKGKAKAKAAAVKEEEPKNEDDLRSSLSYLYNISIYFLGPDKNIANPPWKIWRRFFHDGFHFDFLKIYLCFGTRGSFPQKLVQKELSVNLRLNPQEGDVHKQCGGPGSSQRLGVTQFVAELQNVVRRGHR